jgi:hypothetical protein
LIKEILTAVRVIAAIIILLAVAAFILDAKYPDQRPPFPKRRQAIKESYEPVQDNSRDIEHYEKVLEDLGELAGKYEQLAVEYRQYNESLGVE